MLTQSDIRRIRQHKFWAWFVGIGIGSIPLTLTAILPGEIRSGGSAQSLLKEILFLNLAILVQSLSALIFDWKEGRFLDSSGIVYNEALLLAAKGIGFLNALVSAVSYGYALRGDEVAVLSVIAAALLSVGSAMIAYAADTELALREAKAIDRLQRGTRLAPRR